MNDADKALQEITEKIRNMRHESHSESDFLNSLLKLMAQSVNASCAFVCKKTAPLWFYPDAFPLEKQKKLIDSTEFLWKHRGSSSGQSLAIEDFGWCVSIPLQTLDQQNEITIILSKLNGDHEWCQDVIHFFHLFSDAPAVFQLYQQYRHFGDSRNLKQEDFSSVFEHLIALNRLSHFKDLTKLVVNDLALRFHYSRVSLGWLDHSSIKICAISHRDHLEKDLDFIRKLENVMSESYDQNKVVVYPENLEDPSDPVSFQHRQWTAKSGSTSILSLPIRVEEACWGVLTVERTDHPSITMEDIVKLQLVLSLITRRLFESKLETESPFKKIRRKIHNELSNRFGEHYSLFRIVTISLLVGLLLIAVIPLQHRVSGTFTLRSDDSLYLVAPFDGYLSDIVPKEGDFVHQGDLVFKLDDKESRIEEAESWAQLQKIKTEVELALGKNQYASYRSSLSEYEQVQARHQLIKTRIDRGTIRTPMDGTVVEIPVKDRRGKAIQKGEVIARLVKLETLYIEIEIQEEDILLLTHQNLGTVTFASRPESKFKMTVDRILPAAEVKNQKNIFILRATPQQSPEFWWRPGMTGIAKLEAGRKSILWILTHKFIDQLYLKYL